jgi:hypothetical protein
MESNRKYNSEFRKNLKEKISNLKNKNLLVDIYNIVSDELINKFTINRNGFYFNLNLLSDNSIELIDELIKSELELQLEPQKMTYETYNKNVNIDQFINIHKLTNQEKTIIKKYRNFDV